MFQGQELGIPHPQNWEIEDYKDVETHKFYNAQVDHYRNEPSNSNVLQQVQSSQRKRPLKGTRYVRHNGHNKTQGPRQRPYTHAMRQLAEWWLHLPRSKALAANE